VKDKHIAVAGLGSGGSAVIDMLVRCGIRRFTLIDPDKLTQENLKRHVLTERYVGMDKSEGMAQHILSICTATICAIPGRFDNTLPGLPEKPDVIASCVDSLACESQINAYSLENNIPVVYAGVHGAAEQAEIITVVPGETPCYECWIREGELPPPSMEKYTDPDYDPTKSPSLPGLWGDVLMAASFQFQALLGIMGIRKKFSPLVLMGLRYPFRFETYDTKERCAVCSDNMEGLCTSI